jgi:hypothetical protein
VLITDAKVEKSQIEGKAVPFYIREFWTARQRAASSVHEVSYRACFKPQLPAFFIAWLSREGDLVYDPFSGRGTTAVQAALMGRRAAANDVSPLSEILARPRIEPPTIDEVERRLSRIAMRSARADIDLSMFYERGTEAEIVSLRRYLERKQEEGTEDAIDHWIRMVATNRLTGHSVGFFSVYTLPPNQAVTAERQKRINQQRNQRPTYRDTRAIIMKKTRTLLADVTPELRKVLSRTSKAAIFSCAEASHTSAIPTGSVKLTVTSPPFLDVVQYAKDNWLRSWFNGLDAESTGARITMARSVTEWSKTMGDVLEELYRVTKPGGWVAFEVGEVRKGAVNLERAVVPLGWKAGFQCEGVLIHLQKFTKTSNIWGIDNNQAGTNTQRIVLFRKA